MTDLEIIEKLGGTCELARRIGVKTPSISYWKRKGIPKLRMIQLKMMFPEVFNEIQAVQPTTTITSD